MSITRLHPRPRLVPELYVADLDQSLAFWRDVLGFRVLYERPDEGFAAIERDGVEFMLEKPGTGEKSRVWQTGALDRPLGRGINFEIAVDDIDVLLNSLARADWPIFFGPEERWYGVGAQETGVRQFLVQDQDGYLLRFSQAIGRRPVSA